MQSHGQTWWHSVQPMQRGRSIVQTWKAELVARAGDRADAIDRADDHARLAAGAHVLVEQGQHFGELLLRHYSLL